MKEITLNAKKMTTKEDAHNYIGRKLDFPDYYGKNLDALWDTLSTYHTETKIVIRHINVLYDNLADYGKKLIGVFEEAASESSYIEFEVEV